MQKVLFNQINKHLCVGLAIIDSRSLKIIYENQQFKDWFFHPDTDNILERIHGISMPSADTISSSSNHYAEIEIKYKGRRKYMKLIFTRPADYSINTIYLSVHDFTSEKEAEFMTDSYISIAEKNKKQLEKANREILLQNKIIEAKNEEILDSISYAKRIQATILPTQNYMKTLFHDFFIYYKPKDIVSGDFYWFDKINDLIFFAVADCTGHGVPGALVSLICHNALRRSVKELNLTDPGKILDKTRELVIECFNNSDNEIRDGMDIALGVLDPKTKILEFSGANNPIYIITNGQLLEIKADKQPVGNFVECNSFTTHRYQLKTQDVMYMFTDGYKDQFGGKREKKFGINSFKALLIEIHQETLEVQRNKIDTVLNEWKGSMMQIDDICIIGIKI